MHWFETLNNDVINHIWSFLNVIDIFNVCIALDMDLHRGVLRKCLNDIVTLPVAKCNGCGVMSMNMKTCLCKKKHKHGLCDKCLSVCDVCNSTYSKKLLPKCSDVANSLKFNPNTTYHIAHTCYGCLGSMCPGCNISIFHVKIDSKYYNTYPYQYRCRKCITVCKCGNNKLSRYYNYCNKCSRYHCATCGGDWKNDILCCDLVCEHCNTQNFKPHNCHK